MSFSTLHYSQENGQSVGIAATASLHQGAARVLLDAIYAESLQVIVALYYLTAQHQRLTPSAITEELQKCCPHTPRRLPFCPASLPLRGASIDGSSEKLFVRRNISESKSPLNDMRSFRSTHMDPYSGPSRAIPAEDLAHHRFQISRELINSFEEAQRLLSRASGIAYLTATHLLRCSHAPSLQHHQLLMETVERLRCSESAWCATILPPLAEWLLGFPEVAQHLRCAVDISDAEPPKSRVSLSHTSVLFPHRWASVVMVEDTLPHIFPFLNKDERRPVPCECPHRWCQIDVLRWVTHTVYVEHSILWRERALLQASLRRWRERRGFRVVQRLSQLATASAEHTPGPPQRRTAARELEPSFGQGQLLTSETYQENKAEEANHSSVAKSPRESTDFPLAKQSQLFISSIASRSETPSVQHEEPNGVDSPHNVVYKKSAFLFLDSVLKGYEGPRTISPCEVEEAEKPGTADSSEAKEEKEYFAATPCTSSTYSTSPPDAISTCTRDTRNDSVELKSHKVSAIQQPPETLLGEPADPSSLEEGLAYFKRRQSSLILRSTFFLWRDKHLYNSMATRYIATTRKEKLCVALFALWRKRYLRRRQLCKISANEKLCMEHVQRKAIEYFRMLLHRWRDVALVRRCLMTSVGRVFFCRWRNRTRLQQYQKRTGQQFFGEHHMIHQALDRWAAQLMAKRADKLWRLHRTRQLWSSMMQRAISLRHMRFAEAAYRTKICVEVLQMWKRQWEMRCQLRSFALCHGHRQRCKTSFVKWKQRYHRRKVISDLEEQARQFLVSYSLQPCWQIWKRHVAHRRQVQTFVAYRDRKYLVAPLWRRWTQRMKLRSIVRQNQLEVSDALHEQLLQCAVLRTWKRRSLQSVSQRCDNDEFVENRKATDYHRTATMASIFFSWHTRLQLVRRFRMDRRRIVSVATHHLAALTKPQSTEMVSDAGQSRAEVTLHDGLLEFRSSSQPSSQSSSKPSAKKKRHAKRQTIKASLVTTSETEPVNHEPHCTIPPSSRVHFPSSSSAVLIAQKPIGGNLAAERLLLAHQRKPQYRKHFCLSSSAFRSGEQLRPSSPVRHLMSRRMVSSESNIPETYAWNNAPCPALDVEVPLRTHVSAPPCQDIRPMTNKLPRTPQRSGRLATAPVATHHHPPQRFGVGAEGLNESFVGTPSPSVAVTPQRPTSTVSPSRLLEHMEGLLARIRRIENDYTNGAAAV